MKNILFILCDDLGWKDLGCYGSTFYETPNLDRLAAGGMRFTSAYASCPVCSPTRASVMTGKYPATVGITQYIGGHRVGALCDVPYFHTLPDSEYTLPMALKERAGYQTWHVGKWHLGSYYGWPERRGFEVNIGGCELGAPRRVGYFAPWNNTFPNLPDGPDGEYLTDRLTDESVRLIRNRERGRPFFLNYWPYAVHTPIEAPARLVEKYRRKARELELDQVNPFVPGETEKITRRTIQSDPVYAAMIENLDANIGRLIDVLEEEGILEDTLIIFTSDNGGLSTAEGSPTCNAPLAEGKGWMYEGGTREPLIAHCPGLVPAGTVSDVVTTTPDFYPTFLEVAGIPLIPTQHVDAVSILPALGGDPAFDRGPVFWHYPHYSNQGGKPGCAVREGDWKLIEFFEDGRFELYNLREDVSEEFDLAADQPEVRERLAGLLAGWRESVHALIPQRNPHWPNGPQ